MEKMNKRVENQVNVKELKPSEMPEMTSKSPYPGMVIRKRPCGRWIKFTFENMLCGYKIGDNYFTIYEVELKYLGQVAKTLVMSNYYKKKHSAPDIFVLEEAKEWLLENYERLL